MSGLPLLVIFLGFLGLVAAPAAAQPRFQEPQKMDTALLWAVGWRQAARHELVCEGRTRSEADRFLTRRYAAREQAIARILGEKAAPEIILTLPSCKHFVGAHLRYERSLRNLEKRLLGRK
jgi:hypothetical protein